MPNIQEALHSLQTRKVGTAVMVLALLLLLYKVIKHTRCVLNLVWIPFLRPAPDLHRYGAWVVITGTTDGIGRAYCHELAKKGLNIILISRTQAKLVQLAEELSGTYNIQTRTCAVDLTKIEDSTFDKVAAAIKDLEVGILINNAGMSYDHIEYIDQLPASDITAMVNINCIAPTLLARMVIPGMKARGRGAIVNLGSGSGLFPACPLLSVYSASKAYIDNLSNSLHHEWSEFGITVQDQAPFYVTTKMSKVRKARLDAPTPAVWVKAGAKAIGKEPTSSPYWIHNIMLAIIRDVLPSSPFIRYIKRRHLSMRAGYYRKKAREEAAACLPAQSQSVKKRR